MKISIYRDLNPISAEKPNPVQYKQLELTEIADVIRVGGGVHGLHVYKEHIKYIRTHTKTEAQRTKSNLPAFTVSAHFTAYQRAIKSPHIYTNLMMLDIDGLDPIDVSIRKQELIDSGIFLLVFVSPSGNGLKAVLRVENTKSKKHSNTFTLVRYWIQERFNMELDKSGSDIARMCFFSYDPDVYFVDNGISICANDLEKRYGGNIVNTPGFEGGVHVLDSAVDKSSVLSIFNTFVAEIVANGADSTTGNRNSFLMELTRLKAYGLTVHEVLPMATDWVRTNGLPQQYSNAEIKNRIEYNFEKYYRHYGGVEFNKVFPITTPVTTVSTQSLVAIPNTIPTTVSQEIQATGYLSDHLDIIHRKLIAEKMILIDAPTGMGKSTLVRLLAYKMNCKVDMILPTKALAEQQETGKKLPSQANIVSIVGSKKLQDKHYQTDVLAACYPAIKKLRSRKATVLVIDEIHTLVTDYGYKSDVVESIINSLPRYDYVIGLSGSMFPLQSIFTKNNYLKFTSSKQFQYQYKLVRLFKPNPESQNNYSDVAVKERDYFINTIQDNKLNVLYMNDKRELKKIQKTLENQGKRVLLFSKDERDDPHNYNFNKAYMKLINKQELIDVDVVLSTCIIQAGVNINNEYTGFNTNKKGVVITFAKSSNVIDIIQFTARFRNCKPSIIILHDQQLGKKYLCWTDKIREGIQQTINGYRETDKTHLNCHVNEYKRRRINNCVNGVTFDLQENYKVDEYFIMYRQLEVLMLNCKNNVRELKQVLQQYNFVDDNDPISYVGHLTESTQKVYGEMGKQIVKDKRKKTEKIVQDIITNKSRVIDKHNIREVELNERYNYLLLHVDPQQIKTDRLLYDIPFRHFKRGLQFQRIETDVKENLQLAASVRQENQHFNTLKNSLKPGVVYTSEQLKEKVTNVRELGYREGKYLTAIKVVYKVERVLKRIDGRVKAVGYKLTELTQTDFTRKVIIETAKVVRIDDDDFFK